MKERKCRNCGAPVDLGASRCLYCDTTYEDEKEKAQPLQTQSASKEGTTQSDLSDREGCLRAILTLGFILDFLSGTL